jgi:hypothetical protein
MGELSHGKKIIKFNHVWGSQLLDVMKAHLMGLIRQGLSPIQGMAQHKAYVRQHALRNEPTTCDTFVLPSDVQNLAKKRANELWRKHQKDPINVKMWVLKNRDSIFYYVEHAPLNLNIPNQDEPLSPWESKLCGNVK